MMIRPTEEVVTKETMDQLKATTSVLYLFGSYTYDDALGSNTHVRHPGS
jgi:hypothetical protein